jgi:hypothetical protein
MMGFLGELRCANCGSENHFITSCPRLGEQHTVITGGTRTCEVNIGGVTTKYVSKVDHDAQVGAMNERINALTAQLAKVKCESDWRWYKDHIEAIQRRYEAQLDMYRKPVVACTCCAVHPRKMTPCKCRS